MVAVSVFRHVPLMRFPSKTANPLLMKERAPNAGHALMFAPTKRFPYKGTSKALF
jgi:hypothetical protein